MGHKTIGKSHYSANGQFYPCIINQEFVRSFGKNTMRVIFSNMMKADKDLEDTVNDKCDAI